MLSIKKETWMKLQEGQGSVVGAGHEDRGRTDLSYVVISDKPHSYRLPCAHRDGLSPTPTPLFAYLPPSF